MRTYYKADLCITAYYKTIYNSLILLQSQTGIIIYHITTVHRYVNDLYKLNDATRI